jgi:hypothetical protein
MNLIGNVWVFDLLVQLRGPRYGGACTVDTDNKRGSRKGGLHKIRLKMDLVSWLRYRFAGTEMATTDRRSFNWGEWK